MMYLDANFFIFVNLVHEKGKRARALLEQIIKGKQAITSSLALDEVMWVLTKNNMQQEMRSIIEDIYSTANLEVKEVSSLIPLRALYFMEHYHLKPRDAFHAAVMEQFGVKSIVTDDADFDKITGVERIQF